MVDNHDNEGTHSAAAALCKPSIFIQIYGLAFGAVKIYSKS